MAGTPDVGAEREGTRRLRYGGNTLAMVLLALAVLVIVNLLVGRVKAQWDTTRSGAFTLSPQTVRIVESLPEPVKVTGFYSDAMGSFKQQAQDLLKQYQAHTDKLQVEFVDPNQQPGRARQLGIQQDATLVFQAGDRRQDVTAPTESQVTSTLLKLVRGQTVTVYFVTGHGERSSDDTGGNGYSDLRDALQRDNFKVQTLNVATAGNDAWKQGVLIMNSGVRVNNVGGQVQVLPASPLLPQEQQALSDYLQNGGRALILLDPQSDPSYSALLAPFGLTIKPGIVLDPGVYVGDPGTPAVQKPEPSAVTEMLPLTVFPRSTGILDAGDQPAGVMVQPLAQTSPQSWLETDPQVARYDEGVDVKGPLRLAVSIEHLDQGQLKSRAVVIGSTDAFVNGFLQAIPGAGNQDLFLNSVNWLAQQEEALGIRPKGVTNPTVVLTQGQSMLVLISSVALFPALIMAAGVVTWWRRR